MGVGDLRRLDHAFHRGVLDTEGYVVENRVVEQNRFLIDVTDEASKIRDPDVPDVRPVNRDGSAGRVIESRNEVHQGGFSRTGGTHDRYCLAFRNIQTHIIQNHPVPVRIAEVNVLERKFPVESVQGFRLLRLDDVVLRVQNLVDPLHRGHTLRDGVPSLREILDRVDDAVEDHHIINEYRRVDCRFSSEDQRSSEPQHDHNKHGAEELAHRVGEGLADGHPVVLSPHRLSDVVEPVGHLLLGDERLDDAKTSESLLHLRHHIAPKLLDLKRFPLQVLSHDSHHPHHHRGEQDRERRHLPADDKKGDEIKKDENRVLDQHLDGAGDGVLDLLHVTAHPGDDVSFLLLREEAERKGEDLVVDVHPDVLHHSGPDRNHHSG